MKVSNYIDSKCPEFAGYMIECLKAYQRPCFFLQEVARIKGRKGVAFMRTDPAASISDTFFAAAVNISVSADVALNVR